MKQPPAPQEIITAKVLSPRGDNPSPALRNVMDGKIGFARNLKDKVWKDNLEIGDRVYVRLEHNSLVQYDEYKYWLGIIVGKLSQG